MNWDLSVCRVCLKTDSESVGLDLAVEQNNEYTTYLDIFNSCTRLDARLDDDLPKNICQHCSNDLFTSFDFLHKASNSDQFLKNSLENEVQYCLEFEEDKEGLEELEIKDTTLIEIDTASYYEESIEPKAESDNEIEPVIENAFEIVQCGTQPDEDDLNEECDEQYEEIIDTEVSIQDVVSEESINKPKPPAGSRSVECKICGKTLKRWSLKHHLKRCHKKEKLQLCSACPKTFTIASDLKIHLKTHDKERERTFICSICRKGFFEKQSLGVHMLRHEGVREYHCQICPKQFITKKSLEVHEFTHNRQKGRFICRYCTKRFPSKADLKVHERFHTGDYPYKCELCDKSYAVKSHYNYHVAKHKGVTYKCDECDKEFINRGSLTTHKFKHRDKMPHECPICKRGFTSPFKLSRHQRAHGPQEEEEEEAQIEEIELEDFYVSENSNSISQS